MDVDGEVGKFIENSMCFGSQATEKVKYFSYCICIFFWGINRKMLVMYEHLVGYS